MRVDEYKKVLEKAIINRLKVLAVGPPGVGKTSVAQQVASRLGWQFIHVSVPLLDISSIRGYPYREGGRAGHALFGRIYDAFSAKKPTLLMFDDIGSASDSVMRAMLELIQFGKIDTHVLPDEVVITAATNDIGHGAGVMGLLEPLKTRFHSIIQVETSQEAVAWYGLEVGWDDDIVSFIRANPKSIEMGKPEKKVAVTYPTPRGWGNVDRWLKAGVEDIEVIAGCVGMGMAGEFLSFRKLRQTIPTVEEVLAAPDTVRIPVQKDALYMLIVALAKVLRGSNAEPVFKFLRRLDQNFRVFCLRDALELERREKRTEDLISNSKPFIEWAMSEEGKTILEI